MRAFRAAYPTMNLNGAVAEKEMFALTRTKIQAMYERRLCGSKRSSMNDHFTPYSALMRSK